MLSALTLTLFAACAPDPCMDGFGRDADDACVALAGDEEPTGGAGADSDAPESGDTETGDTETADTDGQVDTQADSDDTSSEPDTSEPSIVAPPSLTAAEVEALFDQLLLPGLPSVYDYTDAWCALVDEGRDSWCPGGSNDSYSVSHGIKGCVSQSGYHFAGPMLYEVIHEDDREALIFSADGYITNPDGHRFTAGGNVSVEADRTEEGWAWFTDLNGMWSYAPANGWLSSGVSAYLRCEGLSAGGSHEAECTGGYSLDDVDASLYMQHLRLSSSCPQGEGELLLRDGDGAWYSLALSCGDCGQLSSESDESMGTICPELSALADFLAGTTSAW